MTTATFAEFNTTWKEQLRHLNTQLSHHLTTTSTNHTHNHFITANAAAQQLVDEVITHYSSYYHTKTQAGKTDILSLFSASWDTSLERSLHWVTGFRPTTIFHLIYTELSIQYESHVVNILRGETTGDLSELDSGQMSQVSELQGETVRAEKVITGQLTDWQDEMVNGSDGWAAVMCGGEGRSGDAESTRMKKLGEVVEAADGLRMKTIRKVVEVLTPQQAVELMVAVSELMFGIQACGLNHDSQGGGGGEGDK